MIHRNGTYTEFRAADSSPEPSRHLEARGYAVARSLFAPDEVDEIKQDVDRVFVEFGADERSARRSAEEDAMFRYEMLNRSAVCQQAIAKPELLSIIEPLLGEDCHVIANTAWRNEANFNAEHGGGGWHIDAGPHIPLPEGVSWPDDIPHPVFAIGVHIYLEDCELDDGPTGVIPGSHLSGTFPPPSERMNDALTYRGEGVVPLLAAAGDVGLFVSDVWHRRMRTGPDDKGRYFLQVHYGRRDIAQRLRPTSEINHLDQVAIDRATNRRQRQLIGLHDNFFYDG